MLVLALSAMLLAACGGDDDGGEPTGESTTSQATDTASTTQPPASSTDELRPIVEALLSDWDESLTAILTDPRAVVGDPEHRLRLQLAESFTTDSPYVRDLDVLLQTAYVDQDRGVRPGPNGVAQQTSLLHFTEAPNDDHVGFVFCTYDDGVGYTLSTGADRPPGVGVIQGAGEATRVDGVWLLYRLRQLGHEAHDAGTPNPCPDLVEDDEAGG